MKHINLNARGKYGKASEKALTFDELDYLRHNIENRREKIILIGLAYAGLRISEFVQCRKMWLSWKVLQNSEGKKLKALSINIPIKDRDVVNKHLEWNPKTKSSRTTYILDEVMGELFMQFYNDHPDGIKELFKSKLKKSIATNISVYIIGVKFLNYLQNYHSEKLLSENTWNIQQTEQKIQEVRPKLSSHPLRSTFENLLYYKYSVSLDIAASMLGHSVDIAKKHYLAETKENIAGKLGNQIIK
jgi:integrase